MRKGQAALEFLMTYGWAILVVLAAIAALAYFGVLSPDRFLPSKCTIQGGFSCVEYKFDGASQELKFNVQNNIGADATNVVVDVQSDDCTMIPSAANGGAANTWGSPVAGSEKGLDNGDRTGLLNWSCNPVNAFPTTGKMSADITITYWQSGWTLNSTTGGAVSGTVG
jgi:hypothetical protein